MKIVAFILSGMLFATSAWAASFTPVASSTFTSDESPISEGGVWTNVSIGGTQMKKLGGVATPVAIGGGDAESVYSGSTFNSCQYSKADLTVTGTGGGARGAALYVLAATGANTNYRFAIDHAASNNAVIERRITGTPTTIGSAWTQAFTDGDTFTFAVCNEQLYVFDKTGALVRTGSDVGGGVPTTGKPGMGYSSTETAMSLDNWSGGNFSLGARMPLILFE